jgi:hypothetical protein
MQQNGILEQMNKSLLEKTQNMILEAKYMSRYLFHTNMSQPYPCNKNEMDYFWPLQ